MQQEGRRSRVSQPSEAQRWFEIREHRWDAVSGAVAHFQRAMMMDVEHATKAMRDEEVLVEIEDFIERFNQPTYRGIRVNGVRVATWWSQHGWSRDGRPEADWIQ